MADESLRLNIQHGVDDLQQLRDEIRLKIHLASMDATDAWNKLEPELEEHLANTETLASEASDIGKRAVHDLVEKVREFKRINLDAM